MALVFNPFWFDWQAFLTGATGFAAVWAAREVGFRQAEVSRQQVAILNRQTELEDLKIQADLFARRFAVYDVTHRYLKHVLTTADQAPRELAGDFLEARQQATFLFAAPINSLLSEIHSVASNLVGLQIRALRSREDPHVRLFEESELYGSLEDLFLRLPEEFASSLNLARH